MIVLVAMGMGIQRRVLGEPCECKILSTVLRINNKESSSTGVDVGEILVSGATAIALGDAKVKAMNEM